MRSFHFATRSLALYSCTTRSLAAGIQRIKEKSQSSAVILALASRPFSAVDASSSLTEADSFIDLTAVINY
jgi:hypothetical protein